MSALLVIGAGGHGRVVADAALSAGWKEISFLDDERGVGAVVLGFKVVGTVDDLAAHAPLFAGAVVAIGNASARLRIIERCRRVGIEIVSVVHGAAVVSRFATIGPGSVLFAQSAVNAGARLGTACIVNTGATVDHDCTLGDGVHVCPGAHLAGSVTVGQGSWIGIGAAVKQGVKIGSNAMIGAGAVVVSDVPEAVTVVGVPAKIRSPS